MLEKGREIENLWFTRHPLLAETVILAETPSFGQKTCFRQIAKREESRKAKTKTYFGQKFLAKTEPKQYSVDHYFDLVLSLRN